MATPQERAGLQGKGKRIGRPKAEVTIAELAQLFDEGLSFQAIADKKGISIATAFNLLKHSAV